MLQPVIRASFLRESRGSLGVACVLRTVPGGVYLSLINSMTSDRDNGHIRDTQSPTVREKDVSREDFVLEKHIFSNIFERDIKRVYIYKKAERLAKAIHLVAPAFADSASLRDRVDGIAMGLVDAAIRPPGAARTALSRELLALSSVLSIARTGGSLSSMNAELISREAQQLLQEVAAYEEPRLFLDEAPTLADIARRAGKDGVSREPSVSPIRSRAKEGADKGHKKDTSFIKDKPVLARPSGRQDAVLEVLRARPEGAGIKDISTVIRDVSEKTIQRELIALIETGVVRKEGERRWSTYYIV